MTTGLDLVSAGFGQASGLSITTEGLLILQDLGLPDTGDAAAGPLKVDTELAFDASTFDADLGVLSGDLVVDNSLRTAVLLSLFSDRRASDDEAADFGTDDPRGWALDDLAEIEGDQYGSKLWLLRRAKQIPETLDRAIEYAEEALAWIVSDGIADRVGVNATFPRIYLIGLQIEIVRASQPQERFAFVWEL